MSVVCPMLKFRVDLYIKLNLKGRKIIKRCGRVLAGLTCHHDFNCSSVNGFSVIKAYRIYSNKRRGAYLIFRATSAALI